MVELGLASFLSGKIWDLAWSKISVKYKEAKKIKQNQKFFDEFKEMDLSFNIDDSYTDEIELIFGNTGLAETMYYMAKYELSKTHDEICDSIEMQVNMYYSSSGKAINVHKKNQIINILTFLYYYLFYSLNPLNDEQRSVVNHSTKILGAEIKKLIELLEKLTSPPPPPSIFDSHYKDMTYIYERKNLIIGDEFKLKDYYIEPHFESGDIYPTISKWLNSEQNIMFITGEAGHGKSSLGIKLLYDFVTSNKQLFDGKIENIAYIKLTDIINSSNVKVIATPLGIEKIGFKLDLDTEIQLTKENNLAVYLDGFDEVIDTLREILDTTKEKAETSLVTYLQKYNKVKFVISSRPNYITDNLEKHSVTVQTLRTLNPKEIVNWIDVYNSMSEIKYQCTEADLTEHKTLYDLVSIPLLLQLVAFYGVYSNMRNRADLYIAILDKITERERTRIGNGLDDIAHFHDSLNQCAFEYYKNDENPVTQNITPVLAHFYTRVSDNRVEFIHRSFYQFFFAKYIFNLLVNEDYETLCESLSYDLIDEDIVGFIYNLTNINYFDLNTRKLENFIATTNCIPKNPTKGNRLRQAELSFFNIILVANTITNTKIRLNNIHSCIQAYDCAGLYLQNTVAKDCDLRRSLLNGASLVNINFSSCDLSFSDLDGINLSNSNLANSIFANSDLTSVYIIDSTMIYSNFSRAILNSAYLFECTLNDSDFSYATIFEADFYEVNLINSSFYNAYFYDAELINCTMNDSDFYRANIHNSDFSNSKLISANFTYANLSGTNFSNCDLRGANFNNAILDGAIFDNAIYDKGSIIEKHLANSTK